MVTGSAVSGVGAVVVTGSGPVFIGQGATAGPAPAGPAGVRPGGTGQILAGEIPARPVAFMERQTVADLAGAWDTGARMCVVQAITGGPGVGKTQAAAAYARSRAAAGWPLVAWVTAETQDQLLAGLGRVAVLAGVADDDGDSAVSARNVRRYLETLPGPALIVFDNATDADGLSAFLPAVGAVQVVITSRDRAFTRLGVSVEVGLFTPAQSVAYLTGRTGLQDLDGAAAVAADLGHLPLALAQAATVISDHSWDYTAFRQRMRAAPAAQYLTRHVGDPYPQGAVEAIALAIASVGDQDGSGLTRMIIALLAVLSAEGVSRAILAGLADMSAAAPAVSSPSGWDEALDRVLGRLVGGSILSRSGTGQAFSMHRLVSRVARDREETDGRLLPTVGIAVDLLYALQIPEEEGWLRRETGSQLVGQINAVWAVFSALACAGDPDCRDLTERLISQRNWSVSQLITTADLSRAISIGAAVLADAEQLLGPDHPNTLTSRNNLARAYGSAGRLREAITLFERTLADAERVLGPDHPNTQLSRGNLAWAYGSAGRLREAITLYERALADAERVLGPDHPNTLISRGHLAFAYDAAGQRLTAITLYERTLADAERVLGPHHPETLISRGHLAATHYLAGQLREAIALYERTLADRERVLGPDHPKTLSSRNDLARAYRSAGRLREAIALYERTLADRERVLGPDHPNTLISRGHLADAYWSAGRLRAAITYFRRNAAGAKRAFEPGHPLLRPYEQAIREHLLLAEFVGFLILSSAWLINQRAYYAAIYTSIWLIFIVPGTPTPRMFGRLLASRDWKFMSLPWYQKLLHSALWATRRKHKGQQLQESPLTGDGNPGGVMVKTTFPMPGRLEV